MKEICQQLIDEAIKNHATDLFFQVRENQYEITIRVKDEILVLETFDEEQGQRLINYFKYQAEMDLAEHRRPQVGAFNFQLEEHEYFLRLSSVGDFKGRETLVIRVIYELNETNYFFPEKFLDLLSLTKRRGLILTSGPTGSGKTSLMYAIARKICQNKTVMCLEDPVEIYEPKFLQTQVNLTAGIDYPILLKAALRHRPDILIIGEIRDTKTAKLAVQASLSGHLVLSTVHAKSSKGTIMRLLQLGVSLDELCNCLTAVTYQRLLKNKAGKLTGLFDIGSGKELLEVLDKPIQGFFTWDQQLIELKRKGAIDDETYYEYQQG